MGRTRTLAVALCAATCLLLAACGTGGAQTRPYVVSTWPDNQETITGQVYEIRVTWNESVTLLNPADLRVYIGPNAFDTVAVQRASDPTSAYVRLASGTAFPTATELTIVAGEGSVINGLDHYAYEAHFSAFESTLDPLVPVGLPGMVALFDVNTLTTVDTVPTPAGTEAVGLVSVLRAGLPRRVWVQLDNGGGVGEALAYFDEGDAAMTPVALPTSGGDLLANAEAITVDPGGDFIYAAWRDDASDGIRVFRVDALAATPDVFLDLAYVASGASTYPADLEMREGGLPPAMYVSAHDGGTGVVVKIDRASFLEEDLDLVAPGSQGRMLPVAAGPIAPVLAHIPVARTGTTDLSLIAPDTGVLARPSAVVGSTVDMFGTPDSVLVVQALAGFAADLGLLVRSYFATYADPTALAVSDDVGGVSQGITAAVALRWLGGGSLAVALFDSPAGLVLTLWSYSGGVMTQLDLDGATDGTQAALVDAELPGAFVLGRTWGSFPPP